jgi:hypothetical protein
MNAKMVLLCSLLLSACSAPTGAEKARIVRTTVDAVKLGCQIYRADQSIPRDPAVTEFCDGIRCVP